MTINIYKYKTPQVTAFASYTNGVLDEAKVTECNDPNQSEVQYLPFCMKEWLLVKTLLGGQITLVKRLTVPAKIRLWCASFKAFRKVTYQVSEKEKGNLAKTPMTEDLLKAYFGCNEWWATNYHWSLASYQKNINMIRDLLANGTTKAPKSTFPEDWNPRYAAGLQPAQMQAYQAHLRKLGFKPKADGQGRVMWVRST